MPHMFNGNALSSAPIMNCDCPACRRAITYAEQDAGYLLVCPHCSARMILPAPSGPPIARLLRRPPKPPLFGIRIHPVAAVAMILLLVALGLLIAFVSNPNFMPSINPFPGSVPSLDPRH